MYPKHAEIEITRSTPGIPGSQSLTVGGNPRVTTRVKTNVTLPKSNPNRVVRTDSVTPPGVTRTGGRTLDTRIIRGTGGRASQRAALPRIANPNVGNINRTGSGTDNIGGTTTPPA